MVPKEGLLDLGSADRSGEGKVFMVYCMSLGLEEVHL